MTHAYMGNCVFKNNSALVKGKDLFVVNNAKIFSKCDADTVFCNGAQGIFDQPGVDNTKRKMPPLARLCASGTEEDRSRLKSLLVHARFLL